MSKQILLLGFLLGNLSCCSAQLAIELERQNVLYVGIENIVQVVMHGIPDSNVLVSTLHGVLEKIEAHRYKWSVSEPGSAEFTVKDRSGKYRAKRFNYRVKRIPDPVMLLGLQYGSQSIKSGIFKAQIGLGASFPFENLDFQVAYIQYDITYVNQYGETFTITNKGARFTEGSRKLIDRATAGDTFYFDNIHVKMPGEDISRKHIDGLKFQII